MAQLTSSSERSAVLANPWTGNPLGISPGRTCQPSTPATRSALVIPRRDPKAADELAEHRQDATDLHFGRAQSGLQESSQSASSRELMPVAFPSDNDSVL